MTLSTSHKLDRVRIGDCIHHGIFACDPDAPNSEVAAIMATHRVHALIINDVNGRPAEIVSDTDVVAAAATSDAFSARDVAGTEALSAPSDASLRDAARLMAEHGVSHLIAVDPASGQPAGVLSTTDILSAYGL